MKRKRDKQNSTIGNAKLYANLLPASHLLLYQADDGRPRIMVRLRQGPRVTL